MWYLNNQTSTWLFEKSKNKITLVAPSGLWSFFSSELMTILSLTNASFVKLLNEEKSLNFISSFNATRGYVCLES